MAHFARRRLPRGLHFLLGGTVVAVGFVVLAVMGGTLDFAVGSAPSVRIDTPVPAADR